MRVAKDGTGDFTSIQEAIDSIQSENQAWIMIEIAAGIYEEKVCIEKPWIRLIGQEASTTIITYGDYAYKKLNENQTYGTFNSYTFFVGANHFYAENITIENQAGKGEEVGQAISAYIDADEVHFRKCRFLGNQDTLFTGPLPEAPIEIGSFRGPRENSPRINGVQYYEACYIEGDVDFIFGSATAYFFECEIFSKNRGQEINGYITAPSTPEGQSYGYIFEACRLTSNCAEETVYLGRPWREYGKVAFIECEMGAHIKKEGWHDWNKVNARSLTRFEEYGNFGEGASLEGRVGWSHILENEKRSKYSQEVILKKRKAE
ncbi:MAG: pectinesterase family protein [Cellulosilyticaceae bacterium]